MTRTPGRSKVPLSAGVLPLALVVLFAGRATAQQPFDLFEQGNRAFADGRFADAAALFMRAHELSPHGLAIHNAAVAWERAEDPLPACDAYLEASTFELAQEQAERVRERLNRLCSAFGLVNVDGPEQHSLTVGRLVRAQLPLKTHVKPGKVEFRLYSPDGQRSSVTVVEVAAGQTVQPQLSSLRQLTAPIQLRAINFEVDGEVSQQQEVVGYVLMGLGVIAAGTGIYFGIQASDAAKTFETANEDANTDPERRHTLRREARAKEFRANALFAGAGASGLTGLVLVLTSPTFEF